jgi:tRNA dimethylallyltransferase
MTNKKLIYITGPTGIGKTELSIKIAKKLKTEIISCDSRQFFKELKIGTSPPSRKQLG